MAFFIIQSIGFIIDIIKKKDEVSNIKWGFIIGVILTALGMSNVLFWVFTLESNGFTINKNGNVYVFNVPAPWYIITTYITWFFYVITNSSNLPKNSELLAHCISVFLATISGNFFFARLFTASNLFILDYFIYYSNKTFLGKDIMMISESIYPKKWKKLQLIIGIYSSVIMLALLLFQLYK